MSENERRYRTLFGSEASADKIVGFCRLHKRYITERQMRTKKCIPKGCRAFQRRDCQYWDDRDRRKELRRMKKEAGIPSWQNVEIRTDHNGNLVPTMRTKKLKKR